MGTARFERGAIVEINNQKCCLSRKISDAWQLEDVRTGRISELQDSQLLAMYANGKLRFETKGVTHPCIKAPTQVSEAAKLRRLYVVAALKASSVQDLDQAITDVWEKMRKPARPPGRVGVSRGSLVGIYRSLFKPTWIRVVEQSNFLRVAFFDFLTNHWRSRLVDKRSKGVLPTLCRSRRKYLMIGSPGLELCPSSPGKIYTKRQAAAMIGVSVGVLKSLRATDDFEVSDLPTTKAGFHGRDIEAFIQKLKRLVHSGTTNESLPECITLDRKSV